MLTADVLSHFKTATKAAEVLGISKSAVSQWGKRVPIGRAYQIQAITGGQLAVNPSAYPSRTKRKRHQ